MEIHEQSAISSSQASQFFPKEKYYIPKSTLQRNKVVITSLNSGIVTNSFSTTKSTPYTWVFQPNGGLSVFDLSQMYFNIAGKLKLPAANLSEKNLAFGNQFICSLFQTATLSLGGAVIATNTSPGIDGNIQAMLKFDQFDLKTFGLADRQFLINSLGVDANVDYVLTGFPNNAFKFKANTTCNKKSKRFL